MLWCLRRHQCKGKWGSAVDDVGSRPMTLNHTRPPAAGRGGEAGRSGKAGSSGEGSKRGGEKGAVAGCGLGSSIHVFRGDCWFERGWCLSLRGCLVMVVDEGLQGGSV